MRKPTAKIHLKRWYGNRAACGVRSHMVTTKGPRPGGESGEPGRQVRVTRVRKQVTCRECLRAQVA